MVPWDNLNRRLFPISSSSSRRSNGDTYDYELLSSSDSSSSSPTPPHTTARRGSISLPPPTGRLSPLCRKLQLYSGVRFIVHFCTLRRLIYFVLSVPFLLALGVLWSGIPPSYESIREYERRLPQHDLTLPSPEGAEGRYLRFGNGIWGHGLNNVLQEVLLHSHLSHLLHRSYVFEPYTWSHTPFPWTIYDFALRPAQIPLNAFISGPSAGGDMPRPRSVSKEFWEGVCGKERRRAVVWIGVGNDGADVEVEHFSESESSSPTTTALASTTTLQHGRSLRPRAAQEGSRREKWGPAPREAEGDVLLRWWVERLGALEERCVEVRGAPVFDQFLFGSPRILSLWPSLWSSPIITHFSWSPLVQAGVTRNVHLLLPNTASISPASLFPPPPPFSSSSSSSSSSHPNTKAASPLPHTYSPAPLPSLLALHLRRGDYVRHCPRLARWGATFHGFNSFPEFGADELFREPDFLSWGGREEYYRKRCWPSVEEVVRKLHDVRERWHNATSSSSTAATGTRQEDGGGGGGERKLKHLYLMTNGWPSFVSQLRDALLADGWESLTSSLDVEKGLDGEQRWVSMAVDMAVAERAAVLVGNGFSSLTSNIVMLRMAKGMDPKSNHFW